MPKVSIIVPNYNHAPYLEQRIDSILNQTYQDFELILLDDCSTDNSVEVLNRYANHPKVSHYIINKQNSGSTFRQWDKGIALAVGKWIWIAESDDWAESEFLETIIKRIAKEDEDVSVCFTSSFISDESSVVGDVYDGFSKLYDNDFSIAGKQLVDKYMIYQNIIPNASAVIFKKECFSKVLVSELITYKINGDWFLWINLLLKGTCVFVSKPLNYFRRHAGASSPKNVLNFKNIEEAMRINVFLKDNSIIINPKYWLDFWLKQANYSVKYLKINFKAINRVANKLYPFAIFYIVSKIAKKKFKVKFL